MKRIILPICLLLIGCVSTESVQHDVALTWIDENFDEFVFEHGEPRSMFRMQNGMQIYKWSSNRHGDSAAVACEMDILVDEMNYIRGVRITKDGMGQWQISRCAEVLRY